MSLPPVIAICTALLLWHPIAAQTPHTITLGDANNDFTSAEWLGTEGGLSGHLTWDADALYIGITGGNSMVGTFTNCWVVIDTDPAIDDDPRSGNGRFDQPADHSGGADYPFHADVIFELYGASSNDDLSIQDPAPGVKWTVQSGNWSSSGLNNGVQVRRHATDITDIKIPFSETGIAPGATFNILIYLANTGTTTSDNTIYAQWPTSNPNGNGLTDFNGGNPLTHYYTFDRSSSVSAGAARHVSIRTYAGSFTFGESQLANLALIGGGQTYSAGALTQIHRHLFIGYGATFTMGSNIAALTVGGNVINDGSTLRLSTNVGGDLTVQGNWTFRNAATFIDNNRQVTFAGHATQLFSHDGAANFSYLALDKAGGAWQLVNDVNISARLLLGAGNLANITTLNGSRLTLTNGLPDDAFNGVVRDGAGMITAPFTRQIGTSTGARLFPVGDGSNYRSLTLDPTAAPTQAGTVSVAYATSPTVDVVSVNDNGTTIIRQNLSSWTLNTQDLAGGTYRLSLRGEGMQVDDVTHLHVMQSGSVVGTHDVGTGTIAEPLAHRTGLSLSDLSSGAFYIGSSQAATSLPVEWLGFEVALRGGQVHLQWATASERNSLAFEVEYSPDGRDFTTLDRVAAQGDARSRTDYAWSHVAPAGPAAYYRLRQLDHDGAYSHSPIRHLRLPERPTIQLFPNPVVDQLHLSGLSANAAYTLRIVNASGQTVYAGGYRAPIGISHWPKGTYFLQVFDTHHRRIGSLTFLK